MHTIVRQDILAGDIILGDVYSLISRHGAAHARAASQLHILARTPFQSRPARRIHSRGSAILFLAACRATLILGDRGHKGRRVGWWVNEKRKVRFSPFEFVAGTKIPLLFLLMPALSLLLVLPIPRFRFTFPPPPPLPSPHILSLLSATFVPRYSFPSCSESAWISYLLSSLRARSESASLSYFWDNERTIETKSIDELTRLV